MNMYKVKLKQQFSVLKRLWVLGYMQTVLHSISLCELFECKPLMSHVSANLG